MRGAVCMPRLICDGRVFTARMFLAYVVHPANRGRVFVNVVRAPVCDERPVGHDGGMLPPPRLAAWTGPRPVGADDPSVAR